MQRFSRGLRNAVLGFLALGLAACGGGGGGGGSGGSAGDPFNTAEFQVNYGLGSIKALKAYNNSGTGTGVTVAVIDSGIDVDNTEFTGAIHAASTDIVTGSSASLQDIDGHGTFVAGIIGARKNDARTHGVAYEASILAIRTDTIGSCFTSCTFSNNNIAAAIDYAVANGAAVINISLGGAATNSTLRTALTKASNAGVIVVAAAGNSTGASPEDPALYAANSTTLGIAVGSTDSSNVISSFSNRAGTASAKFLVAPGENVVSTGLGGGTRTGSGTSFSTPHVAGAAAVLIERFPTLSRAQVVDLLFTSATDLGAAGTDADYGRGLLNLEAAFAAQGLSVLPTGATIDDGSEELRASLVALGPAFGDALVGVSALRNAIMLDGYLRPYVVDLTAQVSSVQPEFGIANFLAEDSGETVTQRVPGGGSLMLRFSEEESGPPETPGRRPNLAAATGSRPPDAAFFSGAILPGVEIMAGFNMPGQAFVRDLTVRTGLPGLDLALAPQLSLLEPGAGTFAAFGGKRSRATFGLFEGDSESGARSARLVQTILLHRFEGGSAIRFGAGFVEETGSFFRSTASGAFGPLEGGAGRFLTFGADKSLGGGWALHAAYTDASARPRGGGPYLSNWGRVRANAFTAGIEREGIGEHAGRFGLAISQPLRVYDAEADLRVAVASGSDRRVTYETSRVAIIPDGRELDLEAGYRWRPSPSVGAAAMTKLALQPGHVRGARPGFGAGIKVWIEF